jgi:hypothetical protein
MKNEKNKYLYKFEASSKDGKKRTFCILNPTRKMKEDGELYYASRLSQFIAAGILPKILWDKLFKDKGGIISDVDKKEYSDLYVKLVEAREKVDKISVKKSADRSKEESDELLELQTDIALVRKQMQEMELAQINAFEYTAEAKARNKTIVWWSANLGAEQLENGEFKKILGDGTIDEKLDSYDSILENDEFLSSILSRINYLVTIWYLGSANTFKEFESLDAEFLKREVEEDLADQVENEEKQESPLDESNKTTDQNVSDVISKQ